MSDIEIRIRARVAELKQQRALYEQAKLITLQNFDAAIGELEAILQVPQQTPIAQPRDMPSTQEHTHE